MTWRSWLPGVRANHTGLTPEQRQRLAAWVALKEAPLDVSAMRASFVVVDVETSGLDAARDRLLAIGAVRIELGKIIVAPSHYCVLRQERSSDHDNILVHQISSSEQFGGLDPIEALLGFLEFAGKRQLVGYNAAFDESVLRRAIRKFLDQPFRRAWLDLADLAPAIHTDTPPRASLDYWLRRYGLEPSQRHHALADALATAQLFQILLAEAVNQGVSTAATLGERARSANLTWRMSRYSV
jgi:DNA polymerase III subunit epsilon